MRSAATEPARLQRQVPRLASAALLVTLVFTLGYWRYADLDLERRMRERFRQLAERQVSAIADRLHDCERVLRGARALFAVHEGVSRAQFRTYVESIDLRNSLPGVQGIGYAVLIPRANKAAHEASVRAQGFPQYAIWPEADRDVYTSVLYLEPFSGRNLRAFGFDMYAEPTRRIAMNLARDSGDTALTHRLTLVQETSRDVQAGFLMYLPVYATGRPVGDLAERRRALVGWVYSPFRAADLMSAALLGYESEAEVEVFDGGPSPENRLYASPGANRHASHEATFTLDVGGIQWTARFRSSRAFDRNVDHWQPRLILLSGVLLSLLIFSLVHAETRHRARLQAEVRERTAELERARDEAEGASRAKSAFLATVSHELRTPLNAIIGFSSLLLQDVVSPEQRKQLAIINRSGLQLLELIKDILDFTSIEAGHLPLDLQPVHLQGVLAEQCQALRAQARDHGLELQLLEGDAPVVVMADDERLGQVVRNLLTNAVKFTDRGAVTVRCAADGGTAIVEVQDTGVGIPPEQQATLFAPFQRGDKERSHRPGTGLGLAISRRLIEAMGGEIGYESRSGQGSRFWFRLPLAPRLGRALDQP